jgi:hypothetical protein
VVTRFGSFIKKVKKLENPPSPFWMGEGWGEGDNIDAGKLYFINTLPLIPSRRGRGNLCAP